MMNNFMIALYLFGAVLSAVMGFLTLTRMKNEKREYFVLFMFCVSVFALGFMIMMAANTTDSALFGVKIGYIGAMLSTPVFLVFVQKYCEKSLPKIVNFLLFAMAFFVIGIVWTTPYHTLFYTSFRFDDTGLVHTLATTPGILFALGKIHPAVCTAIAVALLFYSIRTADHRKKKRMYILMLCVIAPAFGNLIMLFNVSILGFHDFGLPTLIAAVCIVYFSPIRHDLLESEETLVIKRAFLQDMSHEMKSPLNAIVTSIEFADMQIDAEQGKLPKAGEALDYAREEALRLGRMVDGMVNLTAMSQSGKNRKRVNFSDLLKTSAGAFRALTEQRGNTLDTEIAPGLPHVFIESDQFAQVMTNILTNAADHTQNGRITLTAECDNAYITVCLTDTGEGISPELLPYIFERGISGKGGTGYGLYISKTVVEAHGGRITIDSEQGKGTAVTFTVPVYGGQEAGHENEG